MPKEIAWHQFLTSGFNHGVKTPRGWGSPCFWLKWPLFHSGHFCVNEIKVRSGYGTVFYSVAAPKKEGTFE